MRWCWAKEQRKSQGRNGNAVVFLYEHPRGHHRATEWTKQNESCDRGCDLLFSLVSSAVIGVCAMQILWAQDLAPRAYIITPLHSNAVTLTWSFYDGGLNFNGTIPITGATGTYNVPVFSYYHSFSFFGRSANITASLPYAVGTFSGSVLGAQGSIYRSGLLDFSARLSVNLKGGPAMPAQTFVKWKQKMLLGASLKIIAPTGQYDPTKLINWGIQPLGVQAGIRIFPTLGPLGARWICRRMVLHHKQCVLRHSCSKAANRRTRWLL